MTRVLFNFVNMGIMDLIGKKKMLVVNLMI